MSAETKNPEEWTEERLKKDFPAIEMVYEIALGSYNLAISRADKMDSKMVSVMTSSAAITFGLAVAGKNLGMPPDSWCFIAVTALFAIDALVYSYGRFFAGRGDITVLDPRQLYNEHLFQKPWDFKKDRAFYAGESFHRTMDRVVTPRWQCARILSISLVLKVAAFLVWVATRPSQPFHPTPEKGAEEADYYLYLLTEQMIPF